MFESRGKAGYENVESLPSGLQLAFAKDQNTALRIACGELRQILAMQKAAAANLECEAARQRAATSACALPAGNPWPFQCDRTAQLMASSPGAAELGVWHEAVQDETVTKEAAKGDGEGNATETEKRITGLRAALSASERQRERQAALYRQELKVLHSRLDQVSSLTP